MNRLFGKRNTHNLCVASQKFWCVIFVLVFGLCARVGNAQSQATKIWEFSPYQVQVWYAFDPSVNISEIAKRKFVEDVQATLQRTYRATWKSQFQPLSPEWISIVDRNFDSFSLQDLTTNELSLVASLKHPDTRTIRTMDAAIESLREIYVDQATKNRLDEAAARLNLSEDSSSAKLIAKCVVDAGGEASLVDKINNAEIPVAILPKRSFEKVKDAARSMITLLPWQTDSILRESDKVLFVMIHKVGETFHFKVRELDCPMQYLGVSFYAQTRFWPHAARIASHAITRAFAPIARVEAAEPLTADLRMRAGGLIVDKDNPARIAVGDIMQPIVRRDDRNGVPTLLQPLSFTYAAITGSDEVKMQANVYTYSGGPGLQGRRNRRTRRILLRVRPRVDKTDLKIVVRGNKDKTQSGSFIYLKDMLTGKFELLGRTDWRGQFNIEVPKENGKFLPDAARKARILAKREAEKAALEELAAIDARAKEAEENGETIPVNPPTPAADALAKMKDYDPDKDTEALPLNFPLRLLYIKNGSTVVAKLPLVPGLASIEVAELPDDSRRLEAEAFVRGFQGDILDLIGLRNLYAAQIQLYLKDKGNESTDKAYKTLEEMRRLDDFNAMAEKMERIQRVMLNEEKGQISIGVKNKIDRMFGTTRTMLQKYLQDDLVEDSMRAVRGE